jgi:hypothetical protein
LRTTKSIGGALALIAASATVISSQQTQSSVSVTGGSATDVLGVTSRALTVAPTFSISGDPRALFTLDASATRFDNQQWSLGGGLSSAFRTAVASHAALTLNANAAATTTSYDFSYETAGVLPALELGFGPVTAFAGGRLVAANVTTAGSSVMRSGPFGSGPLSSSGSNTVTRTGRGLLFGGNVRVVGGGDETAVVGAREEHSTVASIPMVDRTLTAAVFNGRITVSGALGRHEESGSGGAVFGNGAFSVAVSPNAAIEVNAGSYPVNRLVGTSSGRYVNIGLSLRTGRANESGGSVAGVAAPLSGFTRLSIRATDARSVEVAGDFTNWQPIAARRTESGVWYLDLRIPPGQYRYAFRVDGAWRVPEGATAVDDDFGGKSAWLVVAAPAQQQHSEE